MKVKVGNKVYDGEDQPVIVILTDQDKKNIANIFPECQRYCMYPETKHWIGNDNKNIKEWMDAI